MSEMSYTVVLEVRFDRRIDVIPTDDQKSLFHSTSKGKYSGRMILVSKRKTSSGFSEIYDKISGHNALEYGYFVPL